MSSQTLRSVAKRSPVTRRKVAPNVQHRLISGWTTMWFIALAGCQSGQRQAISPLPGLVSEDHASAARLPAAAVPSDGEERQDSKNLGKFNITFYYVIGEEEVASKSKPSEQLAQAVAPASPTGLEQAGLEQAHTEEAELSDSPAVFAAVAPVDEPSEPQRVSIYAGASNCRPIASVTREFASELVMQGTGKLRDGRTVNIWGACGCDFSPCFQIVGNEWGYGGNGRQLQPFRTVAVDPKKIPLGTLLYIPALEGRRMPGRAPWGGFIHDGCVIADDTGGGIDGNQLDFFVARRAYYHALSHRNGSHRWAKSTEVFSGKGICQRKNGKVNRTSPDTL